MALWEWVYFHHLVPTRSSQCCQHWTGKALSILVSNPTHSVEISEFFPTQILCTFCQNYKLFTNHENKSSSWESSRLAAKNWSSEINSVDSNAQTRPLKAQLWFIFDVRQVRKLPTIHRKNQYHQLWSTYFKSWWDWFLRKIVGNFRTCRTSIKNRNCAFKGRVRASPLSRPFFAMAFSTLSILQMRMKIDGLYWWYSASNINIPVEIAQILLINVKIHVTFLDFLYFGHCRHSSFEGVVKNIEKRCAQQPVCVSSSQCGNLWILLPIRFYVSPFWCILLRIFASIDNT